MPRNADSALRKHLVQLLKGNQAHIDFDTAVKGFPVALRGMRPKGSPHSAWELVEHMRIAQWDILGFTRDAKHVSPKFPDGYWPKSPTPHSKSAWDKSVRAFRADHKAMISLVSKQSTDLFAKIPHGDGQTILKEALVLADHTSYHLGQLMLVRKTLC
jgi:hypothetical protein